MGNPGSEQIHGNESEDYSPGMGPGMQFMEDENGLAQFRYTDMRRNRDIESAPVQDPNRFRED